MPSFDWNIDFTEMNGSTMVNITIKHKALSDLGKIIDLGFKEGFSMALENLDHYIGAL